MSSAEGLVKRVREPAQEPGDDGHEKEKRLLVHKKGLPTLLVATSLPLLLGIVDAIFFNPNQEFYRELRKPWWNPPGWLFGVAWSLLYPAMGLASWLVWTSRGPEQRALMLYVIQLALNLAWPYLFFGRHQVGLALLDISALAAVLTACIAVFSKANHVAGNLLKPYLAWILFATALNCSIWTMNRTAAEQPLPHDAAE